MVHAAAKMGEPDPILKRLWHLLDADRREQTTLALVALSEVGLRRDTLVDLLRYHRMLFDTLRTSPMDCRERSRVALREVDEVFIGKFCDHMSVLIARHKVSREPFVYDATAKCSNEFDELLDVITGLRAALKRIIEIEDPELAAQAHFLLARRIVGRPCASASVGLAHTALRSRNCDAISPLPRTCSRQ